jgi:glycine cleavage system P protein (glycine dehydrogenase) subunit 1
MPYIPNTETDRAAMLKRIGVEHFEELLENVPQGARIKSPLELPAALSEPELEAEFASIAGENTPLVCFAGAGIYDHYLPAAVKSIISRPEFMTAYTPYQAEVAQGTLQVIYEFQTHICRLTGMEVANASMYDGASAAAEAVLTAMAKTKRKSVVLAGGLSPLYTDVIKTYAQGFEAEFTTLHTATDKSSGVVTTESLVAAIDDDTACVVVSQPNFFGLFEDIKAIAGKVHAHGGMLVVVADPISLALITPPGRQGADIVVGEGQPLGIPMSYGGPLVGFFATRKELIRKLPGRLVGRTTDADGKPGFTLTLQTREQHIKRARATSNICTNQALCATAATVYLSLLGKHGLRRLAELCLERAHYAAEKIQELDGYELVFPGEFHREFVVACPRSATEIVAELCEQGILAGVDLGRFYPEFENHLLIAFTERRSYQQIDSLIEALRETAQSAPDNADSSLPEPQSCAR